MSRLIDCIALRDALYEADAITMRGLEIINTFPTAEPSKGKWIHTDKTNLFGGHQHQCSVCGYTLMVSPKCDNENYCCNCGADMRGETDD